MREMANQVIFKSKPTARCLSAFTSTAYRFSRLETKKCYACIQNYASIGRNATEYVASLANVVVIQELVVASSIVQMLSQVLGKLVVSTPIWLGTEVIELMPLIS